MKLNVTEQLAYTIISLEGQLDTNTAPKVETEVSKYYEKGHIIFDLSATAFVSSAGLRVFLATAKHLMATGGTLKLCGANEVVTEILEISGFNTIIEVTTDLATALNQEAV